MDFWSQNIFIIGAGDRGSAVSIRIFNSGFRPILIELENPTDLFYFRNFSDSVYRGEKSVDNIPCRYLGSRFTQSEIANICADRKIPCITLSEKKALVDLNPDIVIDCTGPFPEPILLEIEDFECLIRIGTQHKTGRDGHFIIGDYGPYLGRILPVDYSENSYKTAMHTSIDAPLEGIFVSDLNPGDRIVERQLLGRINDINLLAPDNGILAGRLHSGHYVSAHQPLFSIIHPRSTGELDIKIIPSTKYSIAGGVLEAVLNYLYKQQNKKKRETIT